MESLNLFNCFDGHSKSLMCISPKTRQKSNKENRKSLIIKDFRFLLRDSVGIRTQDPQLRRLLLYPTELPNRSLLFSGAVRAF